MKKFLVLFMMLLPLTLTAQIDTVDIFILYHQSNAEGKGYNDQITEGSIYSDYLMADTFGYIFKIYDPEVKQLTVETSRTHPDYHGIDVPFSVKYYQTLGKPCYFIKYAVSNTGMADRWNVHSGDLFDGLFNPTSGYLKQGIDSIGLPYRIAGVIGIGGEKDAVAGYSSQYYDNFKDFIDSVNVLTDNALHIYNRLHNECTYYEKIYRDSVRSAQDSLAEVYDNCFSFNCDAIPIGLDELHFNTLGIYRLGNAMFDTWYNLMGIEDTSQNNSNTVRILLNGNSITYRNNMYQMFMDMTANSDVDYILTEAVAGGSSLQDRFESYTYCIDSVENGNHNFVTIQEYSSYPFWNPPYYKRWAVKWDSLVRVNDGIPVHWMNPAASASFDMNMHTIDSITTLIGKETGSLVAPIGLAWQRVVEALNDTSFLYEDYIHPTYEASYLNACVLYATFTEETPVGLLPLNVNPDTAAYLQTVAWETYQDYISGNATSCDKVTYQPIGFSLHQNYPNPFNPTTTIEYMVPLPGGARGGLSHVQLSVYNTLGQKVATLVNEKQPAGNYKVKFDGSNLATGIYIYQLKTGNGLMLSKKLLLLK